MTRLPLIMFKAGRLSGSGALARPCRGGAGAPFATDVGSSVYCGGGSNGIFCSDMVTQCQFVDVMAVLRKVNFRGQSLIYSRASSDVNDIDLHDDESRSLCGLADRLPRLSIFVPS